MLVCTTCGYVGKPKTAVKGSIFIELVLWLLFIIPGLIYSMWRLTSQSKVCPACGNATMIPANTPLGQKLVGKNGNASFKIKESPLSKIATYVRWTLYAFITVSWTNYFLGSNERIDWTSYSV